MFPWNKIPWQRRRKNTNPKKEFVLKKRQTFVIKKILIFVNQLSKPLRSKVGNTGLKDAFSFCGVEKRTLISLKPYFLFFQTWLLADCFHILFLNFFFLIGYFFASTFKSRLCKMHRKCGENLDIIFQKESKPFFVQSDLGSSGHAHFLQYTPHYKKYYYMLMYTSGTSLFFHRTKKAGFQKSFQLHWSVQVYRQTSNMPFSAICTLPFIKWKKTIADLFINHKKILSNKSI